MTQSYPFPRFLQARFFGSSPFRFGFIVALVLTLFLSSQNVYSADVTLAWNPNCEEDLAGYRIFCREEGRGYDYNNPAWEAQLDELENANEPSCTINNLDDETTYYLVARAFDTSSNESGDSNEVCYELLENVAPTAGEQSITTLEDTSVNITLTATDNDEDPLTYTVVTQPSHGTLSGTAPNLAYLPQANYHGFDTFAFKANDGQSDSNIATVSVTLISVNDTPVANDHSVITSEDTPTNGSLSARDADGDGLTFVLATDGNKGATIITNPLTGAFTYTPDENANGTDTFTFKVNDGASDSNMATVTVAIVPVNDVPMADNQSVTIDKDTPISVTLTGRDPDGDALTYYVVTLPSNGNLSGAAPDLNYTPNPSYVGSDSFTFKANDGTTDSNTATLTIIVNPVNDVRPIEIGEVSVGHDWKWVELSEDFDDPIVVAKSLSSNDGEPAVVRIGHVDATGFEIRVQEWDYLDGIHTEETVGYIVMERGTYTLPDGTMVEAGRFETDMTDSFENIDFSQAFQVAPVVITAVSSDNGPDAVTTRVRNISTNGFELRMQEQEFNTQSHTTETISYIAWEPSSGTVDGLTFEVNKTDDKINHKLQTIVYNGTFMNAPVFLADMQTTDGGDTANVRWQDKDPYGVDVKIVEEQSGDSETSHTTEVVGYMVLSTTSSSSGN